MPSNVEWTSTIIRHSKADRNQIKQMRKRLFDNATETFDFVYGLYMAHTALQTTQQAGKNKKKDIVRVGKYQRSVIVRFLELDHKRAAEFVLAWYELKSEHYFFFFVTLIPDHDLRVAAFKKLVELTEWAYLTGETRWHDLLIEMFFCGVEDIETSDL